MNPPTPIPLPTGPLSEYLNDPAGFNRRVVASFERWIVDLMPLFAVVLSVVIVGLVVARLARRWRDSRLRRGGRRIRILPPPEIDPQGALVFWMGIHALLRPWWRRLLLGQPYICWEVSARPEEIELAVWVPSVVPVGLVERAAEAAWPGARAAESKGEVISAQMD